MSHKTHYVNFGSNESYVQAVKILTRKDVEVRESEYVRSYIGEVLSEGVEPSKWKPKPWRGMHGPDIVGGKIIHALHFPLYLSDEEVANALVHETTHVVFGWANTIEEKVQTELEAYIVSTEHAIESGPQTDIYREYAEGGLINEFGDEPFVDVDAILDFIVDTSESKYSAWHGTDKKFVFKKDPAWKARGLDRQLIEYGIEIVMEREEWNCCK